MASPFSLCEAKDIWFQSQKQVEEKAPALCKPKVANECNKHVATLSSISLFWSKLEN